MGGARVLDRFFRDFDDQCLQSAKKTHQFIGQAASIDLTLFFELSMPASGRPP